jgi:protein-tyrosine phosphatase
MPQILIVCTGNVCRSPIAEAALRARLTERLGDRAPAVSSCGTAGWVDEPATPDAVEAASELGLDISSHRGTRLTAELASSADLILALTAGHRDAVRRLLPGDAARRTFTLKEFARLTEALDPQGPEDFDLPRAVAGADALRDAGGGGPQDEDVVDPFGSPLELYRAVAWEIDETVQRLVRALLGP